MRAEVMQPGMQTRFLFVVGGVMSGIGKGVTTSSIARILKDRGLTVAPVKIDPYMNVDAGTMNPTEHGEVFVTDDGLETDQDIGNYERFLDERLSGAHSITSGQVFLSVIQRERNLEYNGRCVEAVPDIPNEVISRLNAVAKERDADIVLVEIGGTVGEYQNLLYLETARMLRQMHPEHVAVALVSYLPVPKTIGEMKTKPTQQAVRELQGAGLQPDFIIARSPAAIDERRRKKIALFCNVRPEYVIAAPDANQIYGVPKTFAEQRLGEKMVAALGISAKRHPRPKSGLSTEWKKLMKQIEDSEKPLRIGMVGKYFTTGGFVLKDAYISVIDAVKHAAWSLGRKPELVWVDAEPIASKRSAAKVLQGMDGVIVPGGFGRRGVEGKITAIQHVREAGIPFLGLCYGMQLAAVEFARHVAGLSGAHTTEISSDTTHPIIDILPEQAELLAQRKLGASMRLGAWPCRVVPGTVTADAYGFRGGRSRTVNERHRHRYELNNDYRTKLEESGLVISGVNPERNLVEIIELPKNTHPFFVGTQFHPEFRSSPIHPHPLFSAFAAAAVKKR